jgi:alpha-tubulin suppressor-like RCC1 family protein
MKKLFAIIKCVATGLLFLIVQCPNINAQKIYCGYAHTLAVKSDSTLWAWGSNSSGQLGNGNTGSAWSPLSINGLGKITDVAGGYAHSLALKNNGTVWAWGDNSAGQLGDGSLNQRTVAVQVFNLTGVINVAAGYYHSLAIKSDGTVWAWGNNSNGQLGNGTLFGSVTAVKVNVLTGITDIAGGGNHSIALKNNGTVWTWGANINGQLGLGNESDQLSPVQISGLTNVIAISAGQNHSLFLKSDGTVWACGNNQYGQLGTGDSTVRLSPVNVVGLSGVVAIAAGSNHSMALKSDGTVWVWGYNGEGQLGNLTADPYAHPLPVHTLGVSTVTKISAGQTATAVKADGSLWAWGNNTNGQFGNGSDLNAPSAQLSLFSFANLVSRPTFTVEGGAYTTTQTVRIKVTTTGATIHYTLNGNDPTENDAVIASNGPVNIPAGITRLKARAYKTGLGPSEIKSGFYQIGERVIGGHYHSLAIRTDSVLWAWGYNNYGQLGIGSTTQQTVPVSLTSIMGIKDAAGGDNHTVALKRDGTVWAWGLNSSGQLGDGTTSGKITPVQTNGLTGIINVGAGYNHSLAIKSNGTVWVWGDGSHGQLGNGYTFTNAVPVQVSGLTGAIDITGGEFHSVALKSDGTVWAWGWNSEGQLGDGTGTQRLTPVQSMIGSNVVAISAGRSHTLALKSDGTVWAWGRNAEGQLGNEDIAGVGQSFIPVQVTNLTNIVAIAAGEYHSLAIKSGGTVWAWGKNVDGQLSDSTVINRNTPIQVLALGGVSSLSAGTQTLYGGLFSGVHLFFASGNNTDGQIGDSTLLSKKFRVLIHFPGDENGNGLPEWKDYQFLDSLSGLYGDRDRDGLFDWEEIMLYGTDMNNFDTNGDGLADGVNVAVGLSPLGTDTDGDGISNLQEAANGTSPLLKDTDGDGVPDNKDAFPLDRFLTKKPPKNLSDHTAPIITLEQPF